MDIKRSIKNAQARLGIAKLCKHQTEPINSILEHQDTMVIAPTSAGKSAIYQIPALIFPGMTLVIEPTLSLMYDQVNKLQSVGIKASSIDSSLPAKEQRHMLKQVAKEKVKILFVTPERLQNEEFLDTIWDAEISMAAVDECHCVTAWGHGFCPDYLEIRSFIEALPHRPVIAALTATATPEMRTEICEALSMIAPNVSVNSLYRPNLHQDGSCIIYCNTKKMTNAVYDEVKKWYPGDAVKCHSNLSSQVRKGNELLFLNGEKHIMVATSAFGLGVDQSGVNLVVHFSLPLSPIDYYQSAGRDAPGRQQNVYSCTARTITW